MSMARENGAKYKREKGENRMKFSRHGKAFPWMIRAYVERDRFNIHSVASLLSAYWIRVSAMNKGKGVDRRKGQLRVSTRISRQTWRITSVSSVSEIKIIDTIGKSSRNVRSLRDFHLCADFSFKNYTRNEILAVKERERVDVQGGEISQK